MSTIKTKRVRLKNDATARAEAQGLTDLWYLSMAGDTPTEFEVVDYGEVSAVYSLADDHRASIYKDHVEDIDVPMQLKLPAMGPHTVKLVESIRLKALSSAERGHPYKAWYLQLEFLTGDWRWLVEIIDGQIVANTNGKTVDSAHVEIVESEINILDAIDMSKSVAPINDASSEVITIVTVSPTFTASVHSDRLNTSWAGYDHADKPEQRPLSLHPAHAAEYPNTVRGLNNADALQAIVDEHYHDAKFDQGKIRPSLLRSMPLAFTELAKVLTFGAVKYEENSWQEVPEAIKRYTDAADRHDLLQWAGEEVDEDSQCLHEAQAIINRLFVLELKLRAKKKEAK